MVKYGEFFCMCLHISRKFDFSFTGSVIKYCMMHKKLQKLAKQQKLMNSFEVCVILKFFIATHEVRGRHEWDSNPDLCHAGAVLFLVTAQVVLKICEDPIITLHNFISLCRSNAWLLSIIIIFAHAAPVSWNLLPLTIRTRCSLHF